MRERTVLDLSRLPTFGTGPRSPTWWGTLGFMALEGTGFAIAAGAYLYLAYISEGFPLSAPPPDLGPGTIVLVLLLVSAVPNIILDRYAKKCRMRPVRIYLLIMCAFGILPLIVRWFEFSALNIYWDTNAYGSMLGAARASHRASPHRCRRHDRADGADVYPPRLPWTALRRCGRQCLLLALRSADLDTDLSADLLAAEALTCER